MKCFKKYGVSGWGCLVPLILLGCMPRFGAHELGHEEPDESVVKVAVREAPDQNFYEFEASIEKDSYKLSWYLRAPEVTGYKWTRLFVIEGPEGAELDNWIVEKMEFAAWTSVGKSASGGRFEVDADSGAYRFGDLLESPKLKMIEDYVLHESDCNHTTSNKIQNKRVVVPVEGLSLANCHLNVECEDLVLEGDLILAGDATAQVVFICQRRLGDAKIKFN